MNHKRGLLIVVLGLALMVMATAGLAQDTTTTVTDDQVNEIASKLYCPVCENIPLDACGTAACVDWRYEIRLQLEAGMTEDQIVNDFIDRFGDRVVGTPRDPMLRIMSLVTPWVLVAVLLVIVFRTLTNQGGGAVQPSPTDPDPEVDDLRAQLERDLNS